MKASYSHITVILDRSGSMVSKKSDVIGGFNRFLDEQKAVPGECTVTLVQFDSQDPYEILRDFSPLADVKPLGKEYQPRGNTPLYDAVGRDIADTGAKLEALAESHRPSKVIFVIVTDGLENASREYDQKKVAAMTKEQTEKYGWQFVYLGANQDAMAEGEKVGFTRGMSANYSEQKTSGGIAMAGMKVAQYRTSGSKEDLEFSAQERDSLN